MQSLKKEPLAEFLSELQKLVSISGAEKALEVLKKHNTEMISLPLADEKMYYIVNMVMQEFDYTPELFLYGKHLRGDYKYAVGFCVYFLYPDFSIGEIKKQIFQHKDKSALSRSKDLISNLNPKYKNDQSYLLLKQKFEAKIKQYENIHEHLK